jgi:hypothetical protein
VAADAGRGGHAQIDRELYLPVSWISDPRRCRAAGIPDDVALATKPALARQMINGRWMRACRRAGSPVTRYTGAHPRQCAEMDQRRTGYVLVVARANHVATPARALRADAIAARLPAQARQRPSAFSNTSNALI